MADAVEVRCAYGLAPDALGACVLTLSSFCRKEYRLTQYIYTIFGAIALLAAGYKYWQAVRNSGTMRVLNALHQALCNSLMLLL